MNCVNGKILNIDLTTGKQSELLISDEVFLKYIGGRSLGAKLLYDLVPQGADPLGPENVIFVLTGPTTGTIIPNSCKYVIVSKSPLSGGFLESHSSGYLAIEIKYAGWDGLMLTGKSEKPCYLWIKDDNVEIRDASHLWGLDAFTAEDQIRAETEPRAGTCAIGVAGEKLSLIASVNSDHYRQAARGGTGALFGSKNVKGVAVYGTKGIKPYDMEATNNKYLQMFGMFQNSLHGQSRKSHGTPLTVGVTNKANMLPTKNFQQGHWEEANGNIDAQACERYTIKSRSCYGCMISCSKITKSTDNHPYYPNEIVEGPEYETLGLMGSNLGVSDLAGVIHYNRICDMYGVDTISMGVVVGFVMECWQRGYVTEEQLGMKSPDFGNMEAVSELIRMTAYREGFGDIMAQGVKKTAEYVGHDSIRFAMQVKNVEFPSYDPRAGWGTCLSYAINPRGACHRKAWPPALEILQGIPPYTTENKGLLIRDLTNVNNILHSLNVCDFMPKSISPFKVDEEYANILHCITGETWTAESLQQGGDRGENLTRLFNYREGFTCDDDTLPNRVFDDAVPGRTDPGQRITREHLEIMKNEYYFHRGWDVNGVPDAESLRELGMDEYIPDTVRIQAEQVKRTGRSGMLAARERSV